MTEQYLCNLIIPGAAKSGTSSLHHALGQHPNICMSERKEPHFFCRNDRLVLGAEYHNSLFAAQKEHRIFGESSTGYLPWPDTIPNISARLANPKIIILLRDPIDRVLSHYQWRYRLGLERRSLSDALDQDGYDFDPHHPDQYGYRAYMQFSKYSVYCPRWTDAFGPENVLILKAEDFAARQEATLKRCFRFLGLKPVEGFTAVLENTTEGTFTRVVPQSLKAGGRLVPNFIKGGLYHALRRQVLRRATPRPETEISAGLRARLEDELADDIAFHRALESV